MTTSQRRIMIRVFVVLLVAWLVALAWLRIAYPQPAIQPATAVITHFRPGFGRIQANMVTVTARMQNGVSGTDVVSSEWLIERNCQLGDQVTGEIKGITLQFDALTCAPANAGA